MKLNKKNEEIYIVTDGCMWEQNKQNATYYPHAIEVVNPKTGQIRYVKSGSKILFVEGEITETRSQKLYNKATSKMPSGIENKLQGAKGKDGSRKIIKKTRSKDASL